MSNVTERQGIPAEVIHQRINEEAAQLPEATRDEIEAAIALLGNEVARRSALIELAGGEDEGLLAALDALAWIEWAALKGIEDKDDYYGLAEQVRDSFERVLATE